MKEKKRKQAASVGCYNEKGILITKKQLALPRKKNKWIELNKQIPLHLQQNETLPH